MKKGFQMKTMLAAMLWFLVAYSGLRAQQYATEALRFSVFSPQGTSRFSALGGAMGAIGADLSTASHNPAGIGLFRQNQLSISPGINLSYGYSNWQEQEFPEEHVVFQFGNAGLVLTKRFNRDTSEGLQYLNFSLGYNRMASFNRSFFFEGMDALHSLGDAFMSQANGLNPEGLDPFRERLAFDTYLIDTIPGANGQSYLTNGAFAEENKRMARQWTSSGAHAEVVLSGAINYSNRLYLGATIGIVRLDYFYRSIYRETDSEGSIPVFDRLEYEETLNAEGTGFNLRVGAIYRLTDWWRLGAAIHSPTWVSMDETYSSSLETVLNNGSFTAESPEGQFDYGLTLPWRTQASTAFILGKYFILGLEYEYADYGAINLRPSLDFNQENALIDTTFRKGHQFKAGMEFRINPWSIRAGYQYQTAPLPDQQSTGFQLQSFSAGFGLRLQSWLQIDAVLMLNRRRGTEQIYPGFNDSPLARITHNNWLTQISFSLLF